MTRARPCPTGKRRYPDELAADTALGAIWATPRPGRRLETRTYPCDRCTGWHLTSWGPDNTPPAPARSLTMTEPATDPPATRDEVVATATQVADTHQPDGRNDYGYDLCTCGWNAGTGGDQWPGHLVDVLGGAGVLADPPPPRPPRPTMPTLLPLPQPEDDYDPADLTPTAEEVVAGD